MVNKAFESKIAEVMYENKYVFLNNCPKKSLFINNFSIIAFCKPTY